MDFEYQSKLLLYFSHPPLAFHPLRSVIPLLQLCGSTRGWPESSPSFAIATEMINTQVLTTPPQPGSLSTIADSKRQGQTQQMMAERAALHKHQTPQR